MPDTFKELGYAKTDMTRAQRTGSPEAIFGAGKTNDQLVGIFNAFLSDNRGDVAAYALIGLGGAYLLWALRHRWQHKHGAEHAHFPAADSKGISVWVLFIIFVLGPCEALLPILTASSVLGMSAVVSCTLIFSIATIATMMLAVTLGVLGINALRFKRLEAYAHEIAGGTIMACGVAIICGL